MFWATFPHKVSWISLFFQANTFYSCHSAPEKIERGLSHYLSVLKSIAFHQAYVFEITEWKRKRKENRKNGILRNQIVLPSSTFDLHSAHWSCDVRKEWTSCKWKVFEGIMEAPCVAKELPHHLAHSAIYRFPNECAHRNMRAENHPYSLYGEKGVGWVRIHNF